MARTWRGSLAARPSPADASHGASQGWCQCGPTSLTCLGSWSWSVHLLQGPRRGRKAGGRSLALAPDRRGAASTSEAILYPGSWRLSTLKSHHLHVSRCRATLWWLRGLQAQLVGRAPDRRGQPVFRGDRERRPTWGCRCRGAVCHAFVSAPFLRGPRLYHTPRGIQTLAHGHGRDVQEWKLKHLRGRTTIGSTASWAVRQGRRCAGCCWPGYT